MTTRSISTQNNGNHQRNNTMKKHNKVQGGLFDDFEHIYVPTQPVLSCHSVDIDLSGTRTYRPKSTLDILDEQQKLIRKLYKKERPVLLLRPQWNVRVSSYGTGRVNRTATSAPSKQRKTLSAGPTCNHGNGNRFNIEIKGHPLTSGQVHNSHSREISTFTKTHCRPESYSQLRNVPLATNCFSVVTADKDLLALNQSNSKLENKISSYWKSENNNLATEIFVQCQGHPDNSLPTAESWLTFAGGDGIVDAFASFKNSDEHYNIEGSVGSQIARQLRKGDKIRIGINGAVQSHNLKVRKLDRESICDVKTPLAQVGKEELVKNLTNKSDSHEEEAVMETRLQETVPTEKHNLQDSDERNIQRYLPSPNMLHEDDFKELIISGLDEFDNMDKKNHKHLMAEYQPIPVSTAAESQVSDEEAVMAALKLTTPLSWNDQCSKSNVKIIHAKVSPRKIYKPMPTDVRESSSKVRVVYLNSHTSEEKRIVNGISIDKIVNSKLEGRMRAFSLSNTIKNQDNKTVTHNVGTAISCLQRRASSTKNEPRSRLSIFDSLNSIQAPKLRVSPVHSSASSPTEILQIISTDTKCDSGSKDVIMTTKTPQKACKPFSGHDSSNGNSIKRRQGKGTTEYINIISCLKITSTSAISNFPLQKYVSPSPDQICSERNEKQDSDYQDICKIQLGDGIPESSAEVCHEDKDLSSGTPTPAPANSENSVVDKNCHEHYGKESNSPIFINPLISIPTADEEYTTKNETSDYLMLRE